MALSRFEQLPNELLLRIAAELTDRSGTFESNYSYDGFDVDVSNDWDDRSPTYAMWALCLVSKHLNGPATMILYDSIRIDQLNLSMLPRTIFTQPAQAKAIRQIQIQQRLQDCEYEATSRYSTPLDVVHLAEKAVRALAMEGFEVSIREEPYQHRVVEPDTETAIFLLLVENLRSLQLDMTDKYPEGVQLHSPDPAVNPVLFYRHLVRNASKLPGTSKAPVGCHRLQIIHLKAHKERDLRKEDLAGVAAILKIRSLRNLELEGFHGDNDSHSIPQDHELRQLVLQDCLLSIEDVSALIGTGPNLARFVWLPPKDSLCTILDRVDRLCFRAADVGTVLYPHRKTLRDITFQLHKDLRSNTSPGFQREWQRVASNFSPGLSQSTNSASVRAPMDLTSFLSLKSLRVSIDDLIGDLNLKGDNVELNLHLALPESLQDLSLVVWKTASGSVNTWRKRKPDELVNSSR